MHFARFRYHLVLLFQTVGQLVKIRLIALDFFLLAHGGLHQIEVIAGGLIVRFQIVLRAAVFSKLSRHLNMAILLRCQLFAAGEEIAAQLQRAVEMDAPLVGVTHIVRRHIAGGFGDKVFKEVAIGLRNADRLQRHAVFAQRRFHILKRFAHAAVFRQQIVAQRAGNGAGDTAIERCLNQTVELAAIASGAQTTRHDTVFEHHRMVVGDRAELTELHPFLRFDALFDFAQRQHARLTAVHNLGQHIGRLAIHRQPVNAERFDIDLFIAARYLLQTHARNHALVTRVDNVQHRVAHAGAQLAVQAFIARAAGCARFGGITEVQQRQIRD